MGLIGNKPYAIGNYQIGVDRAWNFSRDDGKIDNGNYLPAVGELAAWSAKGNWQNNSQLANGCYVGMRMPSGGLLMAVRWLVRGWLARRNTMDSGAVQNGIKPVHTL